MSDARTLFLCKLGANKKTNTIVTIKPCHIVNLYRHTEKGCI